MCFNFYLFFYQHPFFRNFKYFCQKNHFMHNIIMFINTDSEVFRWVIMPILIFLARISDQSIGTLRLMFVSKGIKNLATALAFFESLIWLLAVSQIFKHLDNPLNYIAYAGGYATGNYIGIYFEERLSIGSVIVRVIPRKDSGELLEYLRANNFGVTAIGGEGMLGHVNILFSVVKRKELSHFIEIVHNYNPTAFYSIEDVKVVSQSIKDSEKIERKKSISEMLFWLRKVK